MSAHAESCHGSRTLCDQLHAALGRLIPNLKRIQLKRWCGYYGDRKKRFAYVSHFKTSNRVEVWCLGSLAQLQKAGPPHVRARTRTAAGGWEADYPGRFEITSVVAIPSAARLLRAVSYASS